MNNFEDGFGLEEEEDDSISPTSPLSSPLRSSKGSKYIERLVRVESLATSNSRLLERHIREEERMLREQRVIIQEIRDSQVSMKGFWGGMLFVFSAIGVALGTAASHFFK